MQCYIYAADVYCEKCGEAIRARLDRENAYNAPETEYDSDEYPKGPMDVGESDTPQHCGSLADCLEPTVIEGDTLGCFLENDLTRDGVEFVKELHRERTSAVTRFWVDYYGKAGYDVTEPEAEDESA